MGGTLPAALLTAALAFALAFAPRRVVAAALGLLVIAAFTASLAPAGMLPPPVVFAGCWLSVIATAGAVHLPNGVGPRIALLLSVNAGLWAGAAIAVSESPLALAQALPAALLVVPAAWLVAHRGAIAVKVAASWLVAVAILAAALPIIPTPGYAPDHME